MGYVSLFALAMLVAFMFFIIDSVSKMASEIKLILSWVKQQQSNNPKRSSKIQEVTTKTRDEKPKANEDAQSIEDENSLVASKDTEDSI